MTPDINLSTGALGTGKGGWGHRVHLDLGEGESYLPLRSESSFQYNTPRLLFHMPVLSHAVSH